MKKEKTVRTYTRKTKSGKTVTVKQHTAKYDAAEAFKEALKKQGAGSELATKQLTEDELKQAKAIAEENSELDEEYLAAFYPELSPKMVKAVMTAHRSKSATPKAKAANTAGKSDTPDLGFTDKEFKAWYHWDTESDPKNADALKVKKALVAAMGPRAYKSYEKEMTDSYSSRGDKKAFGALPELVQARKDAYNAKLQEKTAKAQAAVASAYGATEAAEKHSARAKSEGEKRKYAEAKLKGKLTKADMETIETPIGDIRKAAKALGLTERETASWMEGPNFDGFKESDLRKGNRAAKKFLGASVYSKLDPNEADVPLAVMAKLGAKGYGGGLYEEVKSKVKGDPNKHYEDYLVKHYKRDANGYDDNLDQIHKDYAKKYGAVPKGATDLSKIMERQKASKKGAKSPKKEGTPKVNKSSIGKILNGDVEISGSGSRVVIQAYALRDHAGIRTAAGTIRRGQEGTLTGFQSAGVHDADFHTRVAKAAKEIFKANPHIQEISFTKEY